MIPIFRSYTEHLSNTVFCGCHTPFLVCTFPLTLQVHLACIYYVFYIIADSLDDRTVSIPF